MKTLKTYKQLFESSNSEVETLISSARMIGNSDDLEDSIMEIQELINQNSSEIAAPFFINLDDFENFSFIAKIDLFINYIETELDGFEFDDKENWPLNTHNELLEWTNGTILYLILKFFKQNEKTELTKEQLTKISKEYDIETDIFNKMKEEYKFYRKLKNFDI